MAPIRVWFAGARPKTLIAGIAPVIVGSYSVEIWTFGRLLLCLTVSLGLQIGINYLNDAADASRGIDQERVGPTRLVASGAASGRAVIGAAGLAVGIASAAGLVLAFMVGPELIVLGVALLLALFGYSAGPRPYASLGLGELLVFIVFGPVAVVGTAYVQSGELPAASWWASVPVGLAAVLLMLANNIRDIDTDNAAGKRTLPARIGRRRAVTLFRIVLTAIFVVVAAGTLTGDLPRASWLALLIAPLAAGPWDRIASEDPKDLVRVLEQSAILHTQLSLALVIAFFFG